MGSRVALLSSIGQSAAAIAVTAATIASYMPFPIIGNLGETALYALGETSSANYAMMMAIGVVPGGKLAKSLGGFVSKLAGNVWRGAKYYAQNYGGAVLRNLNPLSLAKRAYRATQQLIGKGLPHIDFLGKRGGIPATDLWEKLALEEVGSGAVAGAVAIKTLSDTALQVVRPGKWSKYESVRHRADGRRYTIHWSQHIRSGIRWDVKFKHIGR